MKRLLTQIASRRPSRHDEGAALVLALVFLVAVGLVLLAIVTFAGGSFRNTINLNSQRGVEYAADGATTAAAQATRYTYNTYTTPGNCLPGGQSSMTINGIAISVQCSAVNFNPNSAATREVLFLACRTGGSCTTSNAIIQASVTYDDYSTSGFYVCSSATGTQTCGSGMTVNSWLVQNADT
jgi:hypothetical protein